MPLVEQRRVVGWTFARAWTLLLGVALLALAFLALFRLDVGGWDSAGAGHWAHWLAGLGLVGLAAFLRSDRLLAILCALAGVVILATGVFDLATGTLGRVGDPGPGDDALHLVVGLVTLAAGWASRPARAYRGRRWAA